MNFFPFRYPAALAVVVGATLAGGTALAASGSGGQVDVRFRSDRHESRLRAFWRDGPQHEVEEKDR